MPAPPLRWASTLTSAAMSRPRCLMLGICKCLWKPLLHNCTIGRISRCLKHVQDTSLLCEAVAMQPLGYLPAALESPLLLHNGS